MICVASLGGGVGEGAIHASVIVAAAGPSCDNRASHLAELAAVEPSPYPDLNPKRLITGL